MKNEITFCRKQNCVTAKGDIATVIGIAFCALLIGYAAVQFQKLISD